MNNLKEEALNILSNAKGSGKYVSTLIEDFVFPNIEINGIGEIGFPINEIQAKAIISVAQKTPFGMGHETIIDSKIRSSWEIDSKQLNFKSIEWEELLNNVITKTKKSLGIENYVVSAHLYKMLIYETGDFFLLHRDSEKEEGMFGTMVITLPSKFKGGEMIIKFGGDAEIIDFSNASANNKLCISTFYADCEHEIKPLSSGYRVCLVYNLIQERAVKAIQPTSINTFSDSLADAIKRHLQTDNTKPIIVLLGHQYTPENFSLDKLKLNDRHKAEILLQAAQKIDCYAKFCLVTSYKLGSPANDYQFDDYDEEYDMDEVFDESLSIENWLENNIPAFSNIRFEESDLITSFALDEDEPIIKENSGYMGNYGPDIEHWYHYGAVMIWSHETNAQLILTQNTTSKLEWVDYFNKNIETISKSEILAIENILYSGFEENGFNRFENYDAIADWIINRNDSDFFLKINSETCKNYFIKISSAKWLKLLSILPEKKAYKILDNILQDANQMIMEQLLGLLGEMIKANIPNELTKLYIIKIPFYIESILKKITVTSILLNKFAIQNLFEIYFHKPQNEHWTNCMADALLKCTNKKYLNNILVPILLEDNNQTELTRKTLHNCKVYFQKITTEKPLPPNDWTRKMPNSSDHKKQWELLKSFLESPTEKVFEFRKAQQDRSEMENAIKSVIIDLKTETIKKGSPHMLLITKTLDEYERRLSEWEQDLNLFNKITQKIKLNQL